MDLQSYILSKKYTEQSLQGAGALKGKSAYEIACDNGFQGTENDWLNYIIPSIGPEGTWIVNGKDTGLLASPGLGEYATIEYVKNLIDNLEISGGTGMTALTHDEILDICK